MMQIPAFVSVVKTNQWIREVNILISFIFCDQNIPYEELPFLLNTEHLNVSSVNNPDDILALHFSTSCKH